MIGTTELLIIGGVVLILFGSAAIPRFFRSIGKAQSEFEKGKREGAAEHAENRREPERPKDAEGPNGADEHETDTTDRTPPS